MKRITTIAAIAVTAAVSAAPVQAAGFAPWSETRIESKADATQADVTPKAFYRDTVKRDDAARGAEQANVIIKSFYRDGNV